MSGTTTSPTAAYVDAYGIHAPAYNDILTYLQGQMQSIFGSDIVLSNDSQDGQMLGIFALAISDNNNAAIAVYNSYSPSTAQGVGLSSVVKINGIARELPTNSSVDLLIVGVAGTIITGGVVSDNSGNKWSLPSTVTIPVAGQITVTATAQNSGAVTAAAGTLTNISTPTLGWQSVTNPAGATPGAALESDAALTARQTVSTMLPSVTALDGMIGAVANVAGVTSYQPYENDTANTDANGIPSHSVCFVVAGGDDTAIATAIAAHKTPGAGTYGSTTEAIIDAYGITHNINFFRPIVVPITISIHLTALNGYTSVIGSNIVNAIVTYINSIPIGGNVYLSKVTTAANLTAPSTNTFNLTSVTMAANNGVPAAQDITIAFNQQAFTSIALITVAIP